MNKQTKGEGASETEKTKRPKKLDKQNNVHFVKTGESKWVQQKRDVEEKLIIKMIWKFRE